MPTTTPDPHLTVELDAAGIVRLTFTNGDLNMYDLQMRDELIAALEVVHTVPEVRVVLLASAGKHFCVGADLKEFRTAETIFEARWIRWARDPWIPLWRCPVPTIAAINGFALGSGMEMAMLCDYRLASPQATIGLPESTLGMLPAAGGTQSLARTLGADRALPPVILGNRIPAAEAERLGMVEIVEDLPAAADAHARRIAALPPAAVRAATRALRAGTDLPLDAGLRLESHLARMLSALG